MKKKIFVLLIALVTIATMARAQVVLNETNFPDANFRAALADILQISEGSVISKEMIAATKEVNVYRKSIADLMGIEHFTALTRLECGDNRLTSLDMSKNTALERLNCAQNYLTSLNISKNTKLEKLWSHDNKLTSLDVSGCTALWYLDCGDNHLTSLDVSKNAALSNLRCYCNQIKSVAMNAIVENLPTIGYGSFYVIDTKSEKEGNVCTKSQVAVAKEKGWTVRDSNGGEYEGSSENDEVWRLVTDNGDQFPMSHVGMLVAVDESPYFSVLDISGNVLADEVLRVHFVNIDPVSVKNISIEKSQNILKRYVNNELTLIGAKGTVNVYSADGIKMLTIYADGQETIINVSSLPSGTYVVNCGNQSFKFNKK